MIDRVQDQFGLYPERVAADTAYGSAEMLGWLVHERGIEPHIPVFDKSQRSDGTFSRDDFAYDHEQDSYICPAGKQLRRRRRVYRVPRPLSDDDGMMRYRASKLDCQGCSLKPQCCPNTPARKIPRSIHEGARDMARDIADTEVYVTSRQQRKKVEMLFAHLKRILKLDRLRLRGPNGTRDEFHLAATAQNLRKLAMLDHPYPARFWQNLCRPVGQLRRRSSGRGLFLFRGKAMRIDLIRSEQGARPIGNGGQTQQWRLVHAKQDVGGGG